MTTVTLDADTATRRADQTSTPRRADAGDAEQTPDHVPWESLSTAARLTFLVILAWRVAPEQRRRRHKFPPGTRLMGRSLLASRLGRGTRTVSRLVKELADGGWLTIVRHPRRFHEGRWYSVEVQGYIPRRRPPSVDAAGKRVRPARTELPSMSGHPLQGSRRGGSPARPPAPTCVHGVVIGDRFAVDGTSVGGGCFVCESLRVARAAAGPPDAARRPAPADDHVSQVLARARARVSTGESVLDRARARARAARAGRDPYPGPKGDPVA